MKKLLITALGIAVGSFLFASVSNADDLNKDGTPIPIKLPGTGSGIGGHRSPSKVFMWAYYSNGVLSFSCPVEYESLSVSITHESTGAVWHAFIDDEISTIEIGSIAGSYIITATTEDGTELIGYFTIG